MKFSRSFVQFGVLVSVAIPLNGLGAADKICANALLAASPISYFELRTGRESDIVSQYRQIGSRIGVNKTQSSIAFGSNSRWIYAITAGIDGVFLNRWSLLTRELDSGFSLKVPNQTTAIAASVDGTEVAYAYEHNFARYELDTGKQITHVSSSSGLPRISQLEYTQDANNLLIAADSGVVAVSGMGRIMRYSWGHEWPDDYTVDPSGLPYPTSRVTSIGGLLATPEMVDEFNRKRKATQRKVRPGYYYPVWVAGNPDGKQFAVAYLDGTASVFNTQTGNEIALLDAESQIAAVPDFRGDGDIFFDARIEYSLDGQYIVTSHKALLANNDFKNLVSVWDGEYGNLIRTEVLNYGSHLVQLEHPAIAHTHRDGSVSLVDISTNKTFLVIEGTGEVARNVVGTPDGKFLYTLTDTNISEWDLRNRTHRRLFQEEDLRPSDLRMSPEGKYLVVIAQSREGWIGQRLFAFRTGE